MSHTVKLHAATRDANRLAKPFEILRELLRPRTIIVRPAELWKQSARPVRSLQVKEFGEPKIEKCLVDRDGPPTRRGLERLLFRRVVYLLVLLLGSR